MDEIRSKISNLNPTETIGQSEKEERRRVKKMFYKSFPTSNILILLLMQSLSLKVIESVQVVQVKVDPLVWNPSSLYREKQETIDNISGNNRFKRSASKQSQQSHLAKEQEQQLVDACQSKMEIITPYYATNSKGKLRTVVNSELMQQAIQVETCSFNRKNSNGAAAKCNAQSGCGCEQKYKWHRLLVLDPKDVSISKGLFMDWFLFPSSCVCRCNSTNVRQLFISNNK